MMFGLSGNGGSFSRLAARLVFGVTLTAAPAQLASAMQLDGDARELTVVLEDESSPQVVAALAERLGFRVDGAVVDNGAVSGRFRGDLAKVLSSVLPQNGFVIIYEGGKPSRLLLSARDPGGSMAAALPESRSLLPGGYDAGIPFDPNDPNSGIPVNPEGGDYVPDPTEMPVEYIPEVQLQQGIVE